MIFVGVESTLPMFVAAVSLTLVTIAIVMAFLRVLRGPSLPDRVMALDMIGVMSVSVIVLTAIVNDEPVLLDAAIALALISFLGTLAYARFIERRETSDDN